MEIQFPCFMKSDFHVIWAIGCDDRNYNLYGTVIAASRADAIHATAGYYSDIWSYKDFCKCKETSKLLKTLILLKFKGQLHV